MLTWQQIIAAYMPALVILVTVLLAAASYNRGLEHVGKRIDDLRNDTNKRIDDTNKRIGELRDDTNKRIEELGDRLEARLDRLEARLEHPITRP